MLMVAFSKFMLKMTSKSRIMPGDAIMLIQNQHFQKVFETKRISLLSKYTPLNMHTK